MLFFFFAAACAVIYFWTRNININYWKIRNVKYVSKKTPFGVTLDFLSSNRSLAEIYKDIYNENRAEPHVGFFTGSKPCLLLCDLENIQAVNSDMTSFFSRGSSFSPKDKLADNILVMNNYPRWKLIRHKVSPVFTISKLKKMFCITARVAKDFAKSVKENIVLREDPFKTLCHYTAAAIGASVFGIDTQSESTLNSPFVGMAMKSVAPSARTNMIFIIVNLFPWLFRWLPVKHFGNHEELIMGALKTVIKSRENNTQNHHDFIELCMELQRNGTMKDPTTNYEVEPTIEILAAQAFFFFIAGVESSSTAMHFTLIELAHNPDILAQLHAEIDAIFEACDDNITLDEIDKLVYLEMVLNESLRKYPPVGFVQRLCGKETILPKGNLKIEKGVLLITPIFALHRDESYYPNPDIFDPERFREKNLKYIKNWTYLPFGEGRRACIGARYAKMQMKSGLACLLRQFTLEYLPETPKTFEHSFFALRASETKYKLVPRCSPGCE